MKKDPAIAVAELAASMEECADQEDWDRVEELAHDLRNAVLEVPEANRRGALLAARRSTDKVREKARTARLDVTGKLSEIRRGRDAAKAYGSTY